MKALYQFLDFNTKKFLEGKVLKVTGKREWTDFHTKEHLGVRVTVAIAKDTTEYANVKGEVVSNLLQSFDIKVGHDVDVPVGAIVEPINAKATIWGQYRDQLSVKADDIKVISK